MSRPHKREAEKRGEILQTRLTFSERVHVEQLAANAGVTVAELIRVLLLTSEVKPRKTKLEASFLVELNRIGVNLNQIAHASNIGRTDSHILQNAISDLVGIMGKLDAST